MADLGATVRRPGQWHPTARLWDVQTAPSTLSTAGTHQHLHRPRKYDGEFRLSKTFGFGRETKGGGGGGGGFPAEVAVDLGAAVSVLVGLVAGVAETRSRSVEAQSPLQPDVQHFSSQPVQFHNLDSGRQFEFAVVRADDQRLRRAILLGICKPAD